MGPPRIRYVYPTPWRDRPGTDWADAQRIRPQPGDEQADRRVRDDKPQQRNLLLLYPNPNQGANS